jgi:hypothetical protein
VNKGCLKRQSFFVAENGFLNRFYLKPYAGHEFCGNGAAKDNGQMRSFW